MRIIMEFSDAQLLFMVEKLVSCVDENWRRRAKVKKNLISSTFVIQALV